MDYNDIQFRISRLYSAAGVFKEYEDASAFSFSSASLGGVGVIMFNVGNESEEELANKVMNVVSLIFTLKDHLSELTGKKELVENLFDTKALALVADIANAEKHGYPLTKYRRSKKDPKISKIFNAASFGSGYISMNPATGEAMVNGRVPISLCGIVVDKNDKWIIDLEDLIEQAVDDLENFFKSEGIN